MASKSPLVAVDTNVLLDLAFGSESCWDCLDALKRRRIVPRLVVLPTVSFRNLPTSRTKALAPQPVQPH